jgi:DNA-binding HxlR family transcriptional regulator
MSEVEHLLPECPIARFLTVLDGAVATLLVRELTGPKRFTELRTALPGISPTTLSSRLRRFVLPGLVTQTARHISGRSATTPVLA